ncbi:MAG: DUF1592 domain-containing protein [Gammaproteobacteria bacterium]|nr:DUF1592 domain-containing protein [Gammaproteobacteria bacterium]
MSRLLSIQVEIKTISCTLGAAILLGACAPAEIEQGEPGESASATRTRLLTGEQYTNSIAAVFGDDIANSVLPPIPPMTRTDGLLSSGAAYVGVTSDQISQIQQTATSIAVRVVDEDHRDFLIPCRPEAEDQPDGACAGLFLQASGELLNRQPLGDERLAELVDIANYAAEQTEDFYAGLALALESILISPEFVFIVDEQEADPDRPGYERLTAYSLASRLSFFLWNGPPDAALLAAAESGELLSEAGLAAQVDRMIASSRLTDGMRAFFDDMLGFDEFNSLAKDPNVYPMVTGSTLRDAREQTLRTIIDHVITQDADYRDLFVSRKTFMSPALGVVYGIPTGNGWTTYEFPESSPRIGLLTHISFLAANSHAVRSSPTLRGQALRERFLCQLVPDPPPNVDFSLLEEAEGAVTARERLAVHNTNPSCAGCHLITDPMGLSLENFDGAGRFRETENGAEFDISGELDGVFYTDISGLAAAVRDHPKLPSCLINRLFAYGTGGPVSPRYELATLRWLEGRFEASQYKLTALLRDLALSQAFSAVRTEDSQGKMLPANSESQPFRLADPEFSLPSQR